MLERVELFGGVEGDDWSGDGALSWGSRVAPSWSLNDDSSGHSVNVVFTMVAENPFCM